MNIQTLRKLEKNPHYKLSEKQKAELAAARRKPMVEFGSIKKHSNKKPIHDTGQRKRRRVSKKR